jgi:hypothetical protein
MKQFWPVVIVAPVILCGAVAHAYGVWKAHGWVHLTEDVIVQHCDRTICQIHIVNNNDSTIAIDVYANRNSKTACCNVKNNENIKILRTKGDWIQIAVEVFPRFPANTAVSQDAAPVTMPPAGNYHDSDGHIIHLDSDGGYQVDHALLCDLIKRERPNPNNTRLLDLTFRCQGHPYPGVKPEISIEKEQWYATTIDGKLILTTISVKSGVVQVYVYEGKDR